jgi:hypothetical protein
MLLYVLAVVMDEAPISAARPDAPPHVYLHPPTDGCDSRDADEVVVCGSKDLDKRYRLQSSDDARYQQKPIRAEAKIGNATLALRADPRKADDAQDDVYFTPRYSDVRLRLIIPF